MNPRLFSPATLVLALLATGGLLMFVLFYDRAFPQASIDIKVSRAEAQARAEQFLAERGFSLTDYQSVAVFDADEPAAYYLQKSQGMERANQLMRDEIPVWFWYCRWFRPLEKEEYRVRVSPQGAIVRFRREIEEDREGANLDQAAARQIAEQFAERSAGVSLAEYELLDSSTETRKKRTDHAFVWRKKDYAVGEGDLRLEVVVQGDTAGALKQFFKVPERFEREFERERSAGELLTIISLGFTLILLVVALGIFVTRYKANDIRWRFCVPPAGILLALTLAAALNSMPLLKSEYPTEQAYGTYVGIIVVVAVVAAIFYGILILLAGASGDALSREVYPRSVETMTDLMRGRIATPRFAAAAVHGYLLAFLVVGFFTAFYLVGRRFFGIWVPAESPYSNILNTKLPFLYPLLVGFVAAVTEEFVYRFFGVSLLRKYLKSTLLALAIPAVVWAFGHSNYPVFPVYVRGIEVTAIGLLFGYFFIRYDLLTCLIAHYAVDALMVGLPLLRSTNAYFVVSGLAVFAFGLVPLVPAVWGWRRPAEAEPALDRTP